MMDNGSMRRSIHFLWQSSHRIASQKRTRSRENAHRNECSYNRLKRLPRFRGEVGKEMGREIYRARKNEQEEEKIHGTTGRLIEREMERDRDRKNRL